MLFFSILLAALYATPSLADASQKYWTLIPKRSNDNAGNQAITDQLNSIAGDKERVFQSLSKTLGTLYWYAPLNDDDKNKLAPQVRVIGDLTGERGALLSTDPRSPNPSKPPSRVKRGIVSQNPASQALKVVSQSDSTPPDKIASYDYDDSAGGDSRIYVIDTGLASELKEFAGRDVAWLFGGPFADEKRDDSDEYGHGTSMASVALGNEYGVAKKAKLTVVRVDQDENSKLPPVRGGGNRDSLAPLGWLDGLTQTYDAIKNGNEGGKAVVSMSLGFDKFRDSNFQQALEDVYALVINGLIKDLDTPVLAAAGNGYFGTDRDALTVPASLGRQACPDLIAVSGSLLDGKDDTALKDASWVKIKAPSEAVDAVNPKDGTSEKIEGTSPATAMTAGLVAYFETLNHKGGSDARDTLYKLAFPRAKNEKPVLSNVGQKAGSSGPPPSQPSPQPPASPPAPPQPPPPPAPQDMCGAWYKFVLDEYEIRGKNFNADKLGKDGSNLHTKLSHCGKVTDWKFELTPGDPQGYQWKSTGKLPIGTKSCIGSAVKDLGGSNDGCSGPG